MANTRLPSITVASGQTESNALSRRQLQYCTSLAIQSPSTLPETVSVQVTLDGTNYFNLQSGGSDISLSADKILVISPCPFYGLRLLSGAGVGADRTFIIVANLGGT